jgi:protein-S-isoprenylcysteine O-methyltransferase Ste14
MGFVGNFLFTKTIDTGMTSYQAWLIDSLLILLFGLQHSVMARPSFKKIWLMVVPIPIERSTYVLFSCVALALLCGLWPCLLVWQVENVLGYFLLEGLFWFDGFFAFYATFS